MTKILVVEDDNDINQLLCRIVKQSNYDVQSAYSGTEALLYIERETWDLIILDLMLPGMDGELLLQEVRECHSVPVIIISAKDEQATKINMLRSGADDYITKPFDIGEVSARVDSVLRRYHQSSNPSNKKYVHKDLALHLDEKMVTIGGEEVPLTGREFNILQLLMASPNKVFSKENLYESVWKESYYGDDNTVNVHMSNLRNKLLIANPKEEYIETIWGMGYRMKS